MSDFWIIVLMAIGVVTLFVLSVSLTLIFKGRNMQSEIGDNDAMRERGIKCVLHEERKLYGSSNSNGVGSCGVQEECTDSECGSCSSRKN